MTGRTGLIYFASLFGLLALLGGCVTNRRFITDEVVLKDKNTQTGTILSTDSLGLRLKKMDESVSVIRWADVDTIVGKKLKTAWVGVNAGYYTIPYFSVFRNEAMVGRALGMQCKIGTARWGNNLYYAHLTFSPASPYKITKSGFGYQRYLRDATYIKKSGFFAGGEFNFMNAKYNNGSQITLEPFAGYERKLNEQVRVHFKFGLQFNVANKNNSTGSNFTIGFHFMRKNFKKRYRVLNSEHGLYTRK